MYMFFSVLSQCVRFACVCACMHVCVWMCVRSPAHVCEREKGERGRKREIGIRREAVRKLVS